MGTDTASRTLELLRELDGDGRRRQVERWTEGNTLYIDGFTLYKYHLLPRICAESQTGNLLPVHYGLVRVGLRWSYLTEAEEAYWGYQATKLRTGNILPLEPVTYHKFVAGHLHIGPAVANAQNVDVAPQHGHRLFESHARATLACSDTDSAGEVDMTSLWIKLPRAEHDFWHNAASLLPDNVTTPSLRRSERLMKQKLTGSTMPGKTLLGPEIEEEPCSRTPSPVKGEAIPSSDLVPHTDSQSSRCTYGTTVLTEIVDPRPPLKKLRYDPVQQESFQPPVTPRHIHRNSLSEVSLPELQASAQFPTLNILTCGRATCLHYAPMIDTILASIKAIIECHPNMQLDGRHSGVRITFRPDVEDITGVAARLYNMVNDCLEMGMDGCYVRSHIEHVLRPLVAWNLSLPMWGGVVSTLAIADCATLFQGSFTTCLSFLVGRDAPFPFTHDNRRKVVDYVIRALMTRARRTSCSPDLCDAVQAPEVWNGLISCFYAAGLHSSIYEDRVEHQLYLLQARFPQLRLTEMMESL